ncbi:hypothetical protein GCM10008018_17870 [Paenibacillus marchantiophytorum]|uniref:Uncharacterized protein n=1 Tax=Paenibacillus marchantiophytorum TaxID=1619310 RepID=A0ABQ2BX10_9BACL|nr:hypothetical protein GCM10008018_17870 [Paenibacillus marchantiophytorum]
MPNKQNKKAVPSSIGLIILGYFVIAANLRAPLTSVGLLASLIRDDVRISKGFPQLRNQTKQITTTSQQMAVNANLD